jgi:hypothetical protein
MKNQNRIIDELGASEKQRRWLFPLSVSISAIIVSVSWIYAARLKIPAGSQTAPLSSRESAALEEKVLPSNGVLLPVRWGDLGAKMVEAGVIDKEKFESIYAERGGLGDNEKKLLSASGNDYLKITKENSGVLLNLFWALGLSNKNEILEQGPMADPAYGDAEKFASTGGWTLAKDNVMNHYSAHRFIELAPAEQALVERVAKNIYRPCCGNPTYFPDCNHGMAMLGLLELMTSQGVSEDEMYRAALKVNSFWFPETYVTIARYLESKGISWDKADPKTILGYDFSSAQGYEKILSRVSAPASGGGSGCGV